MIAVPTPKPLPYQGPMSSVRVTTVSGRILAAEGTVGADGVFSGTYRLERLVDQYGQSAAVGVFAGSLTTADGAHLGMGSSRHTAATELSSTPDAFCLNIGPVEIVLLGLDVAIDEFTVTIPRELSTLATPGPPAS